MRKILVKNRRALLLGHGGELPGIVEDQTQRGQDGGQKVAGGKQAAPSVAAVAVQPAAHLAHEEQVRCVDDPKLIWAGIMGREKRSICCQRSRFRP